VFWSLAYLAVRCLLQIALLRGRSDEFKELEIVVRRHEVSVLRRQVSRPQFEPNDRVLLAAASRFAAPLLLDDHVPRDPNNLASLAAAAGRPPLELSRSARPAAGRQRAPRARPQARA
jgi:hypothetical protein